MQSRELEEYSSYSDANESVIENCGTSSCVTHYIMDITYGLDIVNEHGRHDRVAHTVYIIMHATGRKTMELPDSCIYPAKPTRNI